MMINNPATARFKSSPVLGAVVVFVDEAGVSGLITGVSLIFYKVSERFTPNVPVMSTI